MGFEASTHNLSTEVLRRVDEPTGGSTAQDWILRPDRFDFGPFQVQFRKPRDATQLCEEKILKEFNVRVAAIQEFTKSDRAFLRDILGLMFDLHRGQFRDDGTPYCQHGFDVFRLALHHKQRDIHALAAYLIHDGAEDFEKHLGRSKETRWKDGLEFLRAHPFLQGDRQEVVDIVEVMTMKRASTAPTQEQRDEEDRRNYIRQYRGGCSVKARAWFGKHCDMLINLADLETSERDVATRRATKYRWYQDELGKGRRPISVELGTEIATLRACAYALLTRVMDQHKVA